MSLFCRSALQHSIKALSRNTYSALNSSVRNFCVTSVSSIQMSDEHRRVLQSAQAVCFDVDSTVIPEEGIDQLAEFMGAGAAVAEWTAKAMGGDVLFEDALEARLSLMKPSKADVERFLTENPPKLTPGVQELVDTLHQRGAIVYLVSGGFRQMIEPVADMLNIPTHRIYANNLLFNESNSNTKEGAVSLQEGDFAGFDSEEPTSRDGGKPRVLQQLIDTHGYQSVVMVGDGVTDMQTKNKPADLFVGYGGVVTRDAVKEGADIFVTDFQDLINVLNEGGAHPVKEVASA